MWNMCLCRCVSLMCLGSRILRRPSDRLQFECDLWARRRSAKVVPNVSRRDVKLWNSWSAEKNIVSFFCDFWNSKKTSTDLLKDIMKIFWRYGDLCVGSCGSDSEGHRQFGDVGPRQSAATCFCLRSCHGLSVCLDVGKSVQVLKLSKKKRKTSYLAFDLRS